MTPFLFRLDGLTMMIEDMDLREHDDNSHKPGGPGSVCLDYVEVWSTNSKTRNKFCGNWNILGNDHISSRQGPSPKMIDYKCKGNETCKSSSSVFYMTVSINFNMGRKYGIGFREKKAFTILLTGFKKAAYKPKKTETKPNKSPKGSLAKAAADELKNLIQSLANQGKISEQTADDMKDIDSIFEEDLGYNQHLTAKFKSRDNDYHCGPDEFKCTAGILSILSWKEPTCIWKKLKCDSHLNCGFKYNSDESGCSVDTLSSSALNPWSVSTMSLLIVIYLAIVLILVLVTMLLLRWHRALRTPLDVLSDSRTHHYPISVRSGSQVFHPPPGEVTISSANLESVHTSDDYNGAAALAAVERGSNPGTVSIMVMYRAQKHKFNPATELPPSYESLFMGENPPNYNLVTVNLPENETLSSSSSTQNGDDNDRSTESGGGGSSNDDAPTAAVQPEEPAVAQTTGEVQHCQCDCDHSSCNDDN